MEFHYGQRVTVISVSPKGSLKIGDMVTVIDWRGDLVKVLADGLGLRLMWKWQVAPVAVFEAGSWADVAQSTGWNPFTNVRPCEGL